MCVSTETHITDMYMYANIYILIYTVYLYACIYTCVYICMHICVTGMLKDFGGCTKVMSCPQSTVLLQMAVVLASLIPGVMNAGR